MLDSMKEKLDADEIIVGVMESDSGKVLSLASSERYDPSHITQKDIAALNPKFSEIKLNMLFLKESCTHSTVLNVATVNYWRIKSDDKEQLYCIKVL